MQNIILCPPPKFRFLFGKFLILTFFSLFFASTLSAQACQPVTFYVGQPEDVSGNETRYRITVRADINASNQTTFQLSGVLLVLNVTADIGTPTIVAAGPVFPVAGTVSGSGTTRQLSLFISNAGNALNIADNAGLFFIEVTGVPLSVIRTTLTQGIVAFPAAVYSYPFSGAVIQCTQSTLGGTTVNNGTTTIRPTFVDCTFAATTLYGATERMGGSCTSEMTGLFVPDIQMNVSQLTPAPVQVATFTTSALTPVWEYSGVPSGNYRVTAQYPTGTFTNGFHSCGMTDEVNEDGDPYGDMRAISRHILGLEPFTQAWQCYAADATGDKLITTFDIVQIRKVYNSAPGWQNLFPPWELVPEAVYNEAQDRLDNDLNPLTGSPINYVEINNLEEGNRATFYAIKNGDVDGSCTNCSPLSIVSAPEDRDFTEGNSSILFPKLKGKSGDILNIPILSGIENNCFYLGMALRFDPAYMEVVSTNPSDRFGISVVEGNSVVYTYLDVDDLAKPGLIKTDQGLFIVKVKLLRDIDAISEYVSFDKDRISHVWFDGPFGGSSLKLETAQGSDLSSSVQLWPNPAHTNLMLTKDTPAEAIFTAFATDGKLVHSQNIGENRSINIAQLLPGIYTYNIVNGDQVTSGRFVKQ